MQVQVSGKQIDIGEALRTHVNDRLTDAVSKYFDRPFDADVTLSKEGHGFRADCNVHLSSGIKLKATGEAADIYASFDGAADRLEKQVRRYKRRLKDHHKSREERPISIVAAQSYVIQSYSEDDEPDTLQPVIIAETTEAIPEFTVGEAVMQMDLAHQDYLLFRNSGHGGLNVVHRRADGNVGWIDPNGS